MQYSTVEQCTTAHLEQFSAVQFGTMHDSPVWYNAVHYNTVQQSLEQCITVSNNATQYSTVRNNAVQSGTEQYSTVRIAVQYSLEHCSSVQSRTLQFSVMENIRVQSRTMQYSLVQCSTVQYRKAPKNAEPRILKCRIKRCDMTVHLTLCSAGQCIALLHKSRLHNRSPRAAQSRGREWHSAVYVRTVQHNEAQWIEPGMEDKTIQQYTELSSTVVQYRTIQYCTVQYSTARHGTAEHFAI